MCSLIQKLANMARKREREKATLSIFVKFALPLVQVYRILRTNKIPEYELLPVSQAAKCYKIYFGEFIKQMNGGWRVKSGIILMSMHTHVRPTCVLQESFSPFCQELVDLLNHRISVLELPDLTKFIRNCKDPPFSLPNCPQALRSFKSDFQGRRHKQHHLSNRCKFRPLGHDISYSRKNHVGSNHKKLNVKLNLNVVHP